MRDIPQIINLDWILKLSLIYGYQLHMDIQLSLIIKLLSQVRNYRTSNLDLLYECNVSDHLIIIMNQDWYPINYSIKDILCTIRIHIYSYV